MWIATKTSYGAAHRASSRSVAGDESKSPGSTSPSWLHYGLLRSFRSLRKPREVPRSKTVLRSLSHNLRSGEELFHQRRPNLTGLLILPRIEYAWHSL